MDADTTVAVVALAAPFWCMAVIMTAYLAASAAKGITSMLASAAQTQMTDTTSPQTTHQA